MSSHITEKQVNDQLEYISKIKSKNERLSWKRKWEKMEKIIAEELPPIDDKIIELQEARQIITDQIIEIRKQMIKECVHPKDLLLHKGHSILCKFCNVNLSLPFNMPTEPESDSDE